MGPRGNFDPSRKRRPFRARPPRVRTKPKLTQSEEMFGGHDAETLEPTAAAPRTCVALQKSLTAMAPLLWNSNFVELLAAEWEALKALGLTEGAARLKAMAPVSSYRQRQLQRNPEEDQRRQIIQGHDMAAAALRQGNQQLHIFSVCARSIAMLAHRTPVKDWVELLMKREVLSRTTTTKLVGLMMRCRPKPPFRQMKGVVYHIFDQTFCKKGASRGKHRAAERVDASGALVELINMVIVNSMNVPLPDLLCGGITDGELNAMSTTGPYTKPFTSILPAIEPDRVKASLYSLMKETGSWLLQARDRFGLPSVSAMKVAHVGRAAMGRPNVIAGRSYIKVNKPILNCDTKSISDGIRIYGRLEEASADDADEDPDAPVALICQSDGQSMILTCRLKKRHPERYRHVVIAGGNFHAFGHFMFGGHEAFFDCYTGYWAVYLGKDKVPKLIPDFENDAYVHTLAHLAEIAIGTLTFFVSDVTNPPSYLFVTNPMLYDTMLKSAGGLAMTPAAMAPAAMTPAAMTHAAMTHTAMTHTAMTRTAMTPAATTQVCRWDRCLQILAIRWDSCAALAACRARE